MSAPESPAEYKRRLLGYVGARDPIAILRQTAALLRPVAAQPKEILHRQPAPGKWSVTQILAHVADIELVAGYRFRTIIGQSGATILGMDPDGWAREMRYAGIPAIESIDRFEAVRRVNLALLETLRDEDWEKYCMHEERGRESLREMVRLVAGHDLNHMQQIDRILLGAAS